jgi:hypothetical protein
MSNTFNQTGAVHFMLSNSPRECIQPIENYSSSDSSLRIWKEIARNAIAEYIKTNQIKCSSTIIAHNVSISQENTNHNIGDICIFIPNKQSL